MPLVELMYLCQYSYTLEAPNAEVTLDFEHAKFLRSWYDIKLCGVIYFLQNNCIFDSIN